ncbi:hypothetical protein [Chloroflexus sp.]|uniref:hypothetical protein n=1 Tax=Chloroflexus sp. TaxID=1904827 RepID=UPI00404AE20B
MPLTITLRHTAADYADVSIAGQRLTSFEPNALLVNQPFTDPCNPVEYGQRLLNVLGGPALHTLLARLPRTPHLTV